jgi:hypothetical protein
MYFLSCCWCCSCAWTISAANVKTPPITRTFVCVPYRHQDRITWKRMKLKKEKEKKIVFIASSTTLRTLLNCTTFVWILISWRTGRTVDRVAVRRPISIVTKCSLIIRNVVDTSTVFLLGFDGGLPPPIESTSTSTTSTLTIDYTSHTLYFLLLLLLLLSSCVLLQYILYTSIIIRVVLIYENVILANAIYNTTRIYNANLILYSIVSLYNVGNIRQTMLVDNVTCARFVICVAHYFWPWQMKIISQFMFQLLFFIICWLLSHRSLSTAANTK